MLCQKNKQTKKNLKAELSCLWKGCQTMCCMHWVTCPNPVFNGSTGELEFHVLLIIINFSFYRGRWKHFTHWLHTIMQLWPIMLCSKHAKIEWVLLLASSVFCLWMGSQEQWGCSSCSATPVLCRQTQHWSWASEIALEGHTFSVWVESHVVWNRFI